MSTGVSEIFEEVFDSHCSGCVRTCACGRTHFDTYNSYDWEEGELEELQAQASDHPDKYIGHDHSIGTMRIDNQEIVYECSCGMAEKYEKFIRVHAELIAEYLNKTSEAMWKKGEAIRVRDFGFPFYTDTEM